jgi:hypothetical protein
MESTDRARDEFEPPERPPATESARRREAREHAMDWAQQNLRCDDPHDLQSRGLQVYFAPQVERGVRVVDLSDGRVDTFRADEAIPTQGYFVEFDSLARYCVRWGAPLQEVDGLVTLQPQRGEAGDPLGHPRGFPGH